MILILCFVLLLSCFIDIEDGSYYEHIDDPLYVYCRMYKYDIFSINILNLLIHNETKKTFYIWSYSFRSILNTSIYEQFIKDYKRS
jgi:hypothetical protein